MVTTALVRTARAAPSDTRPLLRGVVPEEPTSSLKAFSNPLLQSPIDDLEAASKFDRGNIGDKGYTHITYSIVFDKEFKQSNKLREDLLKLRDQDNTAASRLIQIANNDGHNALFEAIKNNRMEWAKFLVEEFPTETQSMMKLTIANVGEESKINLAKTLIRTNKHNPILSMLFDTNISIFSKLSKNEQIDVLRQESKSTNGTIGDLNYTILTKTIVSGPKPKLSKSVQDTLLELNKKAPDAASRLIKIANIDGHNALFEAIKNNRMEWAKFLVKEFPTETQSMMESTIRENKNIEEILTSLKRPTNQLQQLQKTDLFNFLIKNFPNETVSMLQSTIGNNQNIDCIKEILTNLGEESKINLAKALIRTNKHNPILSMLFDTNISIFSKLSKNEQIDVLRQESKSTNGTMGDLNYTILTKTIVSDPDTKLSKSVQEALLELKEQDPDAASNLIKIANTDGHNPLFEAIKHKQQTWLDFFHNHFTDETRQMLSSLSSNDSHDLNSEWLLSVSQKLVTELADNNSLLKNTKEKLQNDITRLETHITNLANKLEQQQTEDVDKLAKELDNIKKHTSELQNQHSEL